MKSSWYKSVEDESRARIRRVGRAMAKRQKNQNGTEKIVLGREQWMSAMYILEHTAGKYEVLLNS